MEFRSLGSDQDIESAIIDAGAHLTAAMVKAVRKRRSAEVTKGKKNPYQELVTISMNCLLADMVKYNPLDKGMGKTVINALNIIDDRAKGSTLGDYD